MGGMSEDIQAYLASLARDECYRVDAVLKESPYETTQRVYFVGANGAERGPFVRKYFDAESGLGGAYVRLWEAQRAGSRFLHLPAIEECYDAGERRAVVMEHVAGETLADVVYRCDPSPLLAADLFPCICAAVRELHERFDPPIIHRDVKPTNIMVARDNVTVIDFGIARSYDEGAEADTQHFGTRAYAPPEQFGYGQTDVRSDVYALGMILYFCLTEKTPSARVARRAFSGEGLPEPLRAVVAQAAAFDPAQRFESVAALERAFAAACAACGVAVGAPSAAGAVAPGLRPAAGPAGRGSGAVESVPPAAGTALAAAPGASSAMPALGAFPAPAAPAPAGPRTRAGRLLARIPFWAGAAWDVLLAAFFVLMAAASVAEVVDPGSAQYAAAPLWLRAVSYGSLCLGVIAPVLFACSDRRPLARLVPPLRAVTLERSFAIAFIALVLGIAVFGVTGQFLPPAQA